MKETQKIDADAFAKAMLGKPWPTVPVLVVAGNYRQFNEWARSNREFIARRVTKPSDLHGYPRQTRVVFVGTWYERWSLDEIRLLESYMKAYDMEGSDRD